MTEAATHGARVADILSRFDETSGRLLARLEQAGERGEWADSGWTPAQIGAHVAMVNRSLASVIDGSGPGASPPAEGFVERAWPDIVRNVPERNEAPARFVPPPSTSLASAVTDLRSSTAALRDALSRLTPERSRYCFTHRLFGTINLYQVGDFAIAHMIRHNQQAKRVLGE
jgi:hypothetical protein